MSIDCYECNGTGLVWCSECDGGMLNGNFPCEECDDGWVDCPVCDGNGELEDE